MQPMFVEDAIPAYAILALCVVTFFVCIYTGFRLRDLPAIGYLVPVVYIAVTYIFIIEDQPIPQEREFFVRIAFILLLADILTWRIVEILAEKKRNGRH